MLGILENMRAQTNPLALRQKIDDLIVQLLVMPVLEQSSTVNVFEIMIKEVDYNLGNIIK